MTKRAKSSRRPTAKETAFNTLADAIGAYLTSVGWSALVVGRPRVRHQPLARDFNYEFVVDFTGGKKK